MLPIAYLWNFCTIDLVHVSKLCGCIFSPLYKRILNVKYFDTIRLVGGERGSKGSLVESRVCEDILENIFPIDITI